MSSVSTPEARLLGDDDAWSVVLFTGFPGLTDLLPDDAANQLHERAGRGGFQVSGFARCCFDAPEYHRRIALKRWSSPLFSFSEKRLQAVCKSFGGQ